MLAAIEAGEVMQQETGPEREASGVSWGASPTAAIAAPRARVLV